MNVDVDCPQCGTRFTIRRDLLGKRTKCTKCGNTFVLAEAPADGSVASAPSPSASSVFSETPPSPPQREPSAIPQFTVDTTARAAGRTRPSVESVGIEHDAPRPRFPALRVVARTYEVMAIFSSAFAVIVFLMMLVNIFRNPNAILMIIVTSGIGFFWLLVATVTMLFVAQTIRLGLQIEQNTRETQQACRQLADHLCSVEVER